MAANYYPGFRRREPSTIGRSIVKAADAEAVRSLIGVSGIATQLKTSDFTASPGNLFLVDLSSGNIIATTDGSVGGCSIVVTATGGYTTPEGSGGGVFVKYKLMLQSDNSVYLTEPGERLDIQSDGANVVFQHVGYSLQDVASSVSTSELTQALGDSGLVRITGSP